MAFFTADFNEIDLSTAWEVQLKDIRAKRLQHQNDLLFTVVRDDIFSRRAEIHAALMTVARTSLTPNGLSIPLWTYKTAHYVKPFREIVGTQEFLDTEKVLRRTGGEWFVGIRRGDESPLHQFYETGFDSIWRWRPVAAVDDVVRHTDFMNRIALLFGDYHYRVSKEVVRRTVLHEPLEVVVEDVELTLHYWPRGTRQHVRDALQMTKEKYETHEADELPGVLLPYVWTGALRMDPPSPVPHAVPSSPPPLARRSSGGGIAHELIRSEADGSLRAYPLSEVAVELFRSDRRPSPCYCTYQCDDCSDSE